MTDMTKKGRIGGRKEFLFLALLALNAVPPTSGWALDSGLKSYP